MDLGQIAGLIAAIAFVVLVALCAVPLLKTGRVLEELRLTIRDMGHNSVPILQELRGTVAATNTEIEKLALVTEDVSKISSNVVGVTDNANRLSAAFRTTVGGPMIKAAAFTYGVKQAAKATQSGAKKGK
ncbi:MAG: DUF948 domain-containing protein [Propionibacteriaceae bacterium]|jgi:uncharacterized protein YoxC|nr:DUF948 domain-containing protein [Propionibacteriaceae bacterium]